MTLSVRNETGTTGDQRRLANLGWGRVMGSAKRKLGGIIPHRSEAKTAPEIKDAIIVAIKSVQRKRAAEYAEVTDETVKSWIANGNAPRFVETVRLARKVPEIRAALYGLIDGHDGHPQDHQKLLRVLDALHEIAMGGGEQGELAHATLKEFTMGKA